MKNTSVLILISLSCVSCASYDVRNWDPNKRTGQIVLFHPGTKDAEVAREHLAETGRCSSGYEVKEIGYRGGGWLRQSKNPETKVTTTSSISVGGKEAVSVERTSSSKSGNGTTIKVGDIQTKKNSDKTYTLVRSPAKTQSSGEMWGKWFDFRCK